MSETQTRVVLAIPPMLGDIVKGIVQDAPELNLVGEVDDAGDLVAATRSSNADFVIAGLQGSELSPACAALLDANSHIKVLAVSGDGSTAYLYELLPEVHALGELSPARLVSAIREATASR